MDQWEAILEKAMENISVLINSINIRETMKMTRRVEMGENGSKWNRVGNRVDNRVDNRQSIENGIIKGNLGMMSNRDGGE